MLSNNSGGKKNILAIGGLGAGILVAYLGVSHFSGANSEEMTSNSETEAVQTITQKADVLEFGSLLPEGSVSILGTVRSVQNSDILAKVGGTVESENVEIGQWVAANQILARLEVSGDATEINYQNSLRNFQTAELSAENSIRNAEVALQTAQRNLLATKQLEQKNQSQNFENLAASTQKANTAFRNSLEWSDETLGASSNFRNSADFYASKIGSNNFVLKNQTKNQIRDLVQSTQSFSPAASDNSEILLRAQQQIDLLNEIKVISENLDLLIRRTPITAGFTETNRDTFTTQSETFSAKIDSEMATLQAALLAAKSESSRQNASLVTAENSVKNAQSALELARANAKNSVATAKNSLDLAQNSRNDLLVRAPFAGKISDKSISSGDQISVGQKLFEIFAPNSEIKIAGFASPREFEALQGGSKILLEFNNGTAQSIDNQNTFWAGKIDPFSQKIPFEISLENPPENVLAGSFVSVGVENKAGSAENSNFLPLSAIAFEPGGAEILVLDANNQATRRKIQISTISGQWAEIVSGINPGEKFIQFRNQVISGSFIEIK